MPAEAPNGWPRALLEGFRAGDRAALTEVYSRHGREVAVLLRRGFNFASGGKNHRFVGYAGTWELQDALHETFRRAFEPRAREGYDGLRPYGPYVRTIARNVVLERFRRHRRQFVPREDVEGDGLERVSVESTSSPVLGQLPAPDASTQHRQLHALVETFLAGLDDLDRRIVELRFVEHMSQREAAAALELGRQRLRTRELAIRRALVAHLRERGELGLVAGIVGSVLPLAWWLAGSFETAGEVLR